MANVNVHEAKTHLSRLLSRVESGEEIVISRAGKPVARLVPVKEKKGKRIPGTAKGLITLSEDFNEPLPEDVLQDFES
ncbi:MAG: type II toxin-antitoxin system Phd/YefM family antitoxin [Thermodesulfovibrionales bacterium]